MEGENKQLNIVTYNCNVFNDKKCLFIRELFQSCDFLLLQEHGQYKSRLDILSCIDENAVYWGSSAMDESVLLSGRPHGGTAIIWKSNVAYNVIPIQCKSVRLSAVDVIISDALSLMIINVYMPCDERYYGDNVSDFNDVLDEISYLMHKYKPTYYICGGDFNSDFSRNSPQTEMLSNFMLVEHFINPGSENCYQIDYRYISSDHQHSSYIDHILLSENLDNCIISYRTVDSVDNLSDHKAVTCLLDIYVKYLPANDYPQNKHCLWSDATHQNINDYKELLDKKLCYVKNTEDIYSCKNYRCNNHNSDISYLYDYIVNACIESAEKVIPQRKPERSKDQKKAKHIPGWNEMVEPHRKRALFWHDMWKEQGSPRDVIVAQIRRSTRAKYHHEIKKVRQDENKIRNQKIAEHIRSKDTKEFWSSIKKVKGQQKSVPNKIDNSHGNQEIADMFANKFSNLYNSVSYDHDKMLLLKSRISDSIKHRCESGVKCTNHVRHITVKDIQSSVKQLKCDKKDGTVNMYTNHVINGTNRLFVLLSLLFTAMLLHGYCPLYMLYGTMTPIPKVNGTTDSDKIRAITLCSTLSKLFDTIILDKCRNELTTSELQYGFKEKSSTDMCTFAIQEIISYYNNHKTNVVCTLSDASKAFDRLEYCILFNKLLNRNICPVIVRLLLYMYLNQSLVVKWNGCFF